MGVWSGWENRGVARMGREGCWCVGRMGGGGIGRIKGWVGSKDGRMGYW